MSDTIGKRLRSTLEACGMTMKKFEDVSGIPYRSLQNYASDQQKPGAEQLLKLRSALHVSIDWLLTGEGSQFIDLSYVRIRPATAGDIIDICCWIEGFENPVELGRHIGRYFEDYESMVERQNLEKKMIESLREKQESGQLSDFDLRSLPMSEVYEIYAREFGSDQS